MTFFILKEEDKKMSKINKSITVGELECHSDLHFYLDLHQIVDL